jgi:tripartite-type tricarboxylate transporter receptor subunit TctC
MSPLPITAANARREGGFQRNGPIERIGDVVIAGGNVSAVEAWYGLVAPAKTPKDKVAELSKWCAEAMLASDLKPKWALLGLTPVGSTSSDFAGHLRKQTDEYARVIRDAGIKGE